MTNKGSDLLVMEHVTAGYGEAVVLEDVSLTIKEGESLALLGRNGMGKTTLLLTMMGLTQLHKGKLFWKGSDITDVTTYKRAQAGLGWVPQERHMYPSLSVEEHLTVVARPGEWTVPKIYQLFPRLQERRNNMGNQLSGGEQQMLAIARALMVNPRLLLLDEPMEGLAPIIVQELLGVVGRLVKESGLSVIIVEQHARMALELTERVIVLDRGRIVHDSDSQELLDDDAKLQRLVAVA
ncbi:ABC transporter ATP-binding protein [Pusillimonas noertemannii]|uniref:Amino acid/amide ABC transporter ATP-binding protein 2 (HAAT family) n=1 Tax=Pusillimonas noertemannii TaxID=305977 RepID=A0A2U1CLE9_9BURK|nr:ABC transporter ATP-binding protein [Pusillimonas noertemannii]NYT69383.1 ABC transporter ATP-binding protein [Pusillimonas noertemannii]PVY61849.1 amino acid/amide ABC transporter ATP-binding protein 2 (HAAT family) [Pusillimonas noertemannii]TFL09777.1 ABC transporter ATP-binding protein [Pusillimonas noertemannii]